MASTIARRSIRPSGPSSPAHRAVVVLHHYADLPLTEVARIVGVGPATARTRLHYALRALRAALEAQDRPVIEELSR